MTIKTCMDLVQGLTPSQIDTALVYHFLSDVEAKVRVELLGEDPVDTAVFDASTAPDTELTAPRPYDQLYWMYLLAMLAYVQGDVARYENMAALFNAAYQGYGRWLKRRGV